MIVLKPFRNKYQQNGNDQPCEGSINELKDTAFTKKYEPHQEEHIEVGEYLKSAVYGGVDSVINILTVILGGVASNSLPSSILAIGIATLFGDGIGMGLGDYLSAKS